MRKIVADKIGNEVMEWSHKGMVSDEVATILADRYGSKLSAGRTLLRWLGIVALILLGMSITGMIGMAIGDASLYIAPFLMAGFAWICLHFGVKMARDPVQRFPTSGSMLITCAMILTFGAIALVFIILGDRNIARLFPYGILLASGLSIATAYKYHLRWPLLLGVLGLFHAIGNMHTYGGRGSYFMGIQDERLTFLLGALAIAFGLVHERRIEHSTMPHTIGFGQIYLVCGLLYANISLWFLSIAGVSLTAVLLFTGVCIVQIVLGARWHDGRLTGFGIVFLSISLYTRLFESFWDALSKGQFFLLSGILGIGFGVFLERRATKLAKEGAVK